MIFSRVKFSGSYCPRCWILLKDVPLLSYKYGIIFGSWSLWASHAKGRFFVRLQLCVKRKKISSNHDTSVLIVFIFSHNMALFLLSFFFFFRPFFSAVIVGRQCGHKFEGTYPKRGHTCKFWCQSSLPFWLIFLWKKKSCWWFNFQH